MTQAPSTTATPADNPGELAEGPPVHAYTVTGDAATVRLPKGAVMAVIPANAEADAALSRDRSGRFKRSGWIVAHGTAKGFKPDSRAASIAVSREAFEPDARARALLRGLEYARADLRDAGGAYDIDQVRALLHDVSRQAVDKRVKEGSLLAVPGPSNRRRFPTVQFRDDGAVIDGLKEVQEALGYSSPWSVLNFLVNPDDNLNDERPIDVLRRGELNRVLDSARRIGVQGA